MQVVKPPRMVESKVRPLIYLDGYCGDNKWRERVIREFPQSAKGMIADPFYEEYSENFEVAKKWETDMSWSADVISFFFSQKSEQPISLLNLGKAIGRFVIGGGPSRLVISVEKGYVHYKEIEAAISLATGHLHGRWRLVIAANDVEGHAKEIVQAVREIAPQAFVSA